MKTLTFSKLYSDAEPCAQWREAESGGRGGRPKETLSLCGSKQHSGSRFSLRPQSQGTKTFPLRR